MGEDIQNFLREPVGNPLLQINKTSVNPAVRCVQKNNPSSLECDPVKKRTEFLNQFYSNVFLLLAHHFLSQIVLYGKI